MGAIFTCPLEVVKTRLQSSNSGFGSTSSGSGSSKPSSAQGISKVGSGLQNGIRNSIFTPEIAVRGPLQITVPVANSHSRASMSAVIIVRTNVTATPSTNGMPSNLGVLQCLRHIFVNEGVAGLFKGLGPNLMGVFPSRAIYFWAYSTAKRNVNAALPKANRDTPFVHVTSAAMAGNSHSF